MKKQLFFIAIASLFTTLASAADLYVRDFGAGGAYATISAAITAAADGDRIIIRPKAGGIPYAENLVIDKSLSFASETLGAKYLVQGTIVVTPLAGRVVTINNLNLTSSLTTSDLIAGRTTINILNSTTSAIFLQFQNITTNISGTDINGSLYFSNGKITGSRINDSLICEGITDTILSTDGVEIVGNFVGRYIDISQRNYTFKILNNFVGSFAFGTISLINIVAAKNGSINEIQNNTIPFFVDSTGNKGSITITLTAPNTATFSILNNVLSSPTANFEIYATGATVYAYYNMSANAFVVSGVTAASSNVGSAVFTVNSTTTYAVTGANVNAGYPDDEFRDLDLSLNDIGNYGGSNSWANYWPVTPGNKPQINYLNTPRRIYIGTTTLNATGSGYSK